MRPDKRRRIGQTSLEVSQIGLGGAALGNVFGAVSEQAALDTISAARTAGVNYFDTAPLYGGGLSEIRLGAGLPRYVRDEIVISTKVGYSLIPRMPDEVPQRGFADALPFKTVFDFSRDAVMRSLDESLKRLATDRVDIAIIHDPDESLSVLPGHNPYEKSHFAEVMEQTYPTLAELRAQGVVKAVGLGMNQWQMLYDFARAGDFDCFLLAGRYTLLEQESLRQLLPLCQHKKISIIIGSPYNSGVLATGATKDTWYNYAPAPHDILERTRQIEAVCARHNVALQAAALQFPFGHPAVVSVIPGARSAAEVEANLAFFRQAIAADFWAELKHLSLIDPDTPVRAGNEHDG